MQQCVKSLYTYIHVYGRQSVQDTKKKRKKPILSPYETYNTILKLRLLFPQHYGSNIQILNLNYDLLINRYIQCQLKIYLFQRPCITT